QHAVIEDHQPGWTIALAGLVDQTGIGIFGVATVNGVPQVTFAPASGFTGQASITFVVTDAYGQTGSATYTATVTAKEPEGPGGNDGPGGGTDGPSNGPGSGTGSNPATKPLPKINRSKYLPIPKNPASVKSKTPKAT